VIALVAQLALPHLHALEGIGDAGAGAPALAARVEASPAGGIASVAREALVIARADATSHHDAGSCPACHAFSHGAMVCKSDGAIPSPPAGHASLSSARVGAALDDRTGAPSRAPPNLAR
jgi:hypothetical protein